jgi:hypothetical protein
MGSLAERKERKMENSKHKTHQTKVTSDHCHIFVGDFCRIVYLFVWYNFLCILGCFCCHTMCCVFFFWWQPSQSKGQQAPSLLVSSPSSRPSSPDVFDKEAAMFLVSDNEEKSTSDYSQQEATTIATSTVAARVILQPPPPHHVQTDPILQNSGRNHCRMLWVVENCEEDEEGWQEAGPKGRVSVASTSRLSMHKSGVNGLSQNYSGGGGGSVQNGVHHRYDAGILRGGNVIHQEKGNHNNQVPRKKKPVNGSILPLLTSSSVGIIRKQISTVANNQDRGSLSKIASYSHVSIPKKEIIAHQMTHPISHKQDRSSKNKTAHASVTTQVTTTTQYGGPKHMLLDNTSRASKAPAAASTHAGRTMFSYKDVAVAQPGTHTSIWPELEHLTATTSNSKSEEPVTSEKLLPKKQTSTPMMSDSENSGKISPEEAEVAVSKEVTADDATTPMTADLTVAQPSLDDRSETHNAIIASSTAAAAPLIVEVSDTNVSPTSNDGLRNLQLA